MGNADTKLNFRKAVIQLTTKTQPVEANDEAFWSQFWSDSVTCIQDVFTLIPALEIRALREENPSNLATLCYKAVEKIVQATETSCRSYKDQQIVLNCVRLLSRILPYIFEDPDWRGFFWSTLPGQTEDAAEAEGSLPLAQSLISALCDLLFCPEFTVTSSKKSGPDNPEDLQSIDSCEYIWEAGVGFAHSPAHNAQHDYHRTEILKLLLTCFSESMYLPPVAEAHAQPNQWIAYFTSTENRHALPLFTSLLNITASYDPVGYGVPYNHLMFTDSREPLVEVSLQVLCVTLEHELNRELAPADGTIVTAGTPMDPDANCDSGGSDNLFVNYMSRVHREEDFLFILKGITRLLNNPLMQTYLPGSCKRVQFHQELLVLFWKMCDINKKFMFYVLKSSDVLDVLVPILYYLNDARADQSRVGLMHIGVFILLLLSGERNFGVRLNKPYTVRVPMDIPVFTGAHADLLIIVFHKIITSGHQRLQPLFDCLMTIIVNVSPYLKTLSMVASTKLLHLLEAFSTPWFLYASPTNHHLVFFLLEVFNNIIQYQFDGNSSLVYTIIRKRNVFHQLANLPTDHSAIAKALSKRGKKFSPQSTPDTPPEPQTMEGALPATEAEPGTLKATLAAYPGVDNMTERRPPQTPGSSPTHEAAAEKPTLKELAGSGDVNNDKPKADSVAEVHEEQKGKSEKHSPPGSPTSSIASGASDKAVARMQRSSSVGSSGGSWVPSPEWVHTWKQKLPLQTIMRLLQVLVPQVEKICIDKGLTDESEILKFLQHGTLVGLLPVPHPILIRKYQPNSGTTMWFRTYMWGVIYLRNVDPPIWYDTDVKLFEIQRV
ncbi:protein HID1 isoform X3 [Lingula anatina]|uniref:Protein HID1 isoform X3 n=1 Tax=Lingula anatina TaxID=7574 RepID=A0A1S3HIK8_LINAN|nr:protein HID1 isoform X3 [Lingula anatina]|eukprot:XP_013385950.1 protein HID1 isoform X3 [Lingula anatina]